MASLTHLIQSLTLLLALSYIRHVRLDKIILIFLMYLLVIL